MDRERKREVKTHMRFPRSGNFSFSFRAQILHTALTNTRIEDFGQDFILTGRRDWIVVLETHGSALLVHQRGGLRLGDRGHGYQGASSNNSSSSGSRVEAIEVCVCVIHIRQNSFSLKYQWD